MLGIMSRQALRRDARAKATVASHFWEMPWFDVMTRRADVQQVCDFARVRYPECVFKKVIQPYPEMLRTQEPDWWGRQLKRANVQEVEAAEIRAGNVKHYCSDTILAARRQHNHNMREMLENLLAICELPDGTRAERELIDLVMASPSNPAVQRAELMANIRGTENYAIKRKHVPMFITVTCPSRLHPNSGQRWVDAGSPTPKAASDYLVDVWSRARPALARMKIKFYGFRIAEPHKDGCPHWHCLFWFKSAKEAARACKKIREYFLMDSPNEPGAQRRRVTLKRIDPKKGSATGYIAKYICKNIDGEYLDAGERRTYSDMRRDPVTGEMCETGIITDEAAARVKAWASCWRIRQFQRIGLPKIGAYRELRRLRETYTGHGADIVEPLRAAADKGQWDLFMELNDEHVARFEKPVKVWTETSADKLAKIDMADDEAVLSCLNKWQEPKLREVKGVRVGWLEVQTRFLKWVLMMKAALEKKASEKTRERIAFAGFMERIDFSRRWAAGCFEAMAAEPPWPLEPCQ